MEQQVRDASHTIEDTELDGWVRGGQTTRDV